MIFHERYKNFFLQAVPLILTAKINELMTTHSEANGECLC